jgi:predicted DCC family thiol-disulfide oxidoreductase YuxK
MKTQMRTLLYDDICSLCTKKAKVRIVTEYENSNDSVYLCFAHALCRTFNELQNKENNQNEA